MWAFSRMELNEAWYQRLQENRMVIAGQLDAMADVMQDWTKGQKNLDGKSKMLLARIGFEVRERGLVAEQIHIYEDRDKRLPLLRKWQANGEAGFRRRIICVLLRKLREWRCVCKRMPERF